MTRRDEMTSVSPVVLHYLRGMYKRGPRNPPRPLPKPLSLIVIQDPLLTALASVQMEAIAPILEVANDHPYLSAASVILGCAALMRLAQRGRSDLPPGPKGYPIVGNLFDVPSTHAWEKFSEFGEQYGASPSPIVTCLPLW